MVTNNELDKLEALAQSYLNENSGQWYNIHQIADGITLEPAASLVAALDPATVLQLIDLARRSTSGSDETQSVKVDELIAAADAVVERWHSRDWKQPHTAEFIARLAAAVGAAKRAALAQQATTASASIGDDPEFHRLLANCEASNGGDDPRDPADTLRALIAYIDSRTPTARRDAASDAPAAEEVRDKRGSRASKTYTYVNDVVRHEMGAVEREQQHKRAAMSASQGTGHTLFGLPVVIDDSVPPGQARFTSGRRTVVADIGSQVHPDSALPSRTLDDFQQDCAQVGALGRMGEPAADGYVDQDGQKGGA